MTIQKKNSAWLLLSILVIALDQISKYSIATHLKPGEIYPVTPFFNLWFKYNNGAAFSFLNDSPNAALIFIGIAVVVSVLLLIWLLYLPQKNHWQACALAFVLGGAIGNLIDRVVHGYVIDFLDFYIKGWHWATFNLADSAICVGAVMLLLELFFTKKAAT